MWVASAGGPLIVMGQSSLKKWNGTNEQGSSEPALHPLVNYDGSPTDYGRACVAKEGIDILQVDDVLAIVFNGMPVPIAWFAPSNHMKFGFFACIENTGIMDYDELNNILIRVPPLTWEDSGLTFDVNETKYILFDSADPGMELIKFEFQEFELVVGHYRIEKSSFSPNEETLISIYRLVL